ncbi:TPA: Blp family class II bacteriocin [Streptococcus pyogenes]|uniref:Blp family class II bacteriocin n=1 Tax=Streptococcus pyogenes TaxID=1314 RepID=UPI0010A16805|nr:Blp family class II bacteriocin [Streptococcus pyogenes]VHD42242.1 Uncharacterised protein [Streptococcus pyogenes]HEP1491706.1 Blp family class II bacteriocin [Streptococcus pyogenes]
MNTTKKQFEVIDDIKLSLMGGGSKISVGEVGQALAVCTLTGATIGSVFPIAGTLGGAVLGAQYCTGAWAIIRAH